ncbi:class I SAM-dependent rRNA methyltransferase [Chryseolinea sp. T2]|uniref:class I SAM-dependent rRNA methyltransferase n=1 Tax=Chryseolinea sp. T2 TaxID=3129255 RepID=UPI003077D4E6
MTVSGNITLKKGKEISMERRHPWVFSGAIHHMDPGISDGSWVRVLDAKGNVLAMGHYQHGSIAVRILSFGKSPLEESFWEQRLFEALAVRSAVNVRRPDTNCFRLIHGEGDGLPGLIIDYYDGVAVVQAHSVGMHLDRERIAAALDKVFDDSLRAIYYKSHSTLPGRIDNASATGYLKGMGGVPHIVVENGCKFYVDWEEGQKTGFFLDQRDNRSLLMNYVNGKRVLNTFCYTGGFSIYAINGGASLVHSVDVSERAIGTARNNIALNHFDVHHHACFASDTFEFMKNRKDEYDVIVLDPPAFAKHRDARHQAVKGYQRLNADAMRVIRPGGILFTFSCSQVVDKKLFYDTVVSAGITAGRQIKVLHHLTQGADHPVSLFHPEGEYLKGLVLYVE